MKAFFKSAISVFAIAGVAAASTAAVGGKVHTGPDTGDIRLGGVVTGLPNAGQGGVHDIGLKGTLGNVTGGQLQGGGTQGGSTTSSATGSSSGGGSEATDAEIDSSIEADGGWLIDRLPILEKMRRVY